MKLNELLKTELGKMGFKKKGYNFFLKINDNVYAAIGFTTASHQIKGRTLLNPIIGISHDDVNAVYDNLCGIRHVLAPTIWIPIGYLMPEKKYKEWELVNDTDNTETLSDMLLTIRQYGMEYWHKMTDFNTLFDAVIARPIGLLKDRQNRLLPILYYMRGEKEKGQQVIDAAIKEMQRPKTDGELLVGVPDSVQNKTKIFRVGLDTVSNNDLNQMVKTMPSESAIVFAGSALNGFVDPEYLKFAERYKALP